MKELHEAFGWQFVTQHREFFIYRNLEADPRELHTDPTIQAFTMKQLNKRLWKGLVWTIFLAILQLFLGILAYPISIAMLMGTVFWVSLMVLLFWQFLVQLCYLQRIRQLRAKLLQGQPLEHRQDWRSGARAHYIHEGLMIFLALVMLISWGFGYIREKKEIPLEELTAEPPFVTLEDMASPEIVETALDRINNGRCSYWSDSLFPQVWDYIGGGGIRYEDSTESAGLIEIQYCETAVPWLARGAAWEFTRFYRMSAFFWQSETTVRQMPELGLDYAAVFENQFGMIRVVLAEGNRAICCRFTMDNEKGNFTTENWLRLMTQELLEDREAST